MSTFDARLDTLAAGLDPSTHAVELGRLRACRTVAELTTLAATGWLSPEGQRKRVRLVRHGSGTFLLVEYDDGWTKTLSQG